MFGKRTVVNMIERSAESDKDRRNFLKAAGVAGLGTVGATAVGGFNAGAMAAPSDGAVLNFALNLEYLEAEFYSYAAFGEGLPGRLTTGKGDRGGVKGGRAVPFQSKQVRRMAREIAKDEIGHVAFLRKALGGAKVARPKIDLKDSFTAAAQAAGLIGPGQSFDPFADDASFLLAAFLFEDVGVTAYKGASPLINNKVYLEAAAGILAVEAYHAGIVRAQATERGLAKATWQISKARDSLGNKKNVDQGADWGNLVPTDSDRIAFSREADQVLNIVYLNPKSVRRGGFFPKGVNGPINRSSGR
jgi:hypothetical protein